MPFIFPTDRELARESLVVLVQQGSVPYFGGHGTLGAHAEVPCRLSSGLAAESNIQGRGGIQTDGLPIFGRRAGAYMSDTCTENLRARNIQHSTCR